MEKLADLYIFYHKKLDYEVWDNALWTPLEVGAAERDKLLENGRRDNDGENISEWNCLFCENTGTYWIWKHLTDKEYTGQVQYRRRFDIQSYEELVALMDGKKVITEQPLILGQSVRAQYESCHNAEDIAKCERIVKTLYPDYSYDWDKYINISNILFYSNGFIMRTEDYRKYCEWLFSILFALLEEYGFKTPKEHFEWIHTEMQLAKRPLNNGKGGVNGALRYQGEIFGFLSERLFTLYILHNFKAEEINILPYLKYEGV